MKSLNIIILALILTVGLYGQTASAVKMVPFVDPSLQPMPISDVTPNISGNVNFKANKISGTSVIPQTQNGTTSENNTSANQSDKAYGALYLAVWIVISLFIIGLLILAFIFLKPKK